jgi:hypothetical protein
MSDFNTNQTMDSGSIPIRIVGGGSASIPLPPNPLPTTIPAAGTYDSGVMGGSGYNRLAAAVTSSQNGVLSITRYIDAAGTIPIGTVATQALTAGTPGWTWINDGMPFASWRVTVTNPGGTPANITNAALLAAP